MFICFEWIVFPFDLSISAINILSKRALYFNWISLLHTNIYTFNPRRLDVNDYFPFYFIRSLIKKSTCPASSIGDIGLYGRFLLLTYKFTYCPIISPKHLLASGKAIFDYLIPSLKR